MIFALSLFGGGLGVAGAGSGAGQNCGLTIDPTSVSLVVPTNDTGSVAAVVTVTSSLAQTVTFNVAYIGTSPPACLGTPTVTPSTFTFTAGQQIQIAITVPYVNCTTNGLSVHLSLTATTSLGCTTGNLLTGVGTVTTSNTGTFALEAECNQGSPCCAGYLNVWLAATQTDINAGCSTSNFCVSYCGAASDNCPTVCVTCAGTSLFAFRARSINGFAGTINLTCDSETCTDCMGLNRNGCTGWPASVTLTAGQTTTFVAAGGPYVRSVGPTNGSYYLPCFASMSATGVAGAIQKTTFVMMNTYCKACP